MGNIATTTSPLGAASRLRYDADRELVGVVGANPGAGSSVDAAVRLAYNPAGEVSLQEVGTVNSQSDSDRAAFGQLVLYGYDSLGAGDQRRVDLMNSLRPYTPTLLALSRHLHLAEAGDGAERLSAVCLGRDAAHRSAGTIRRC